MKYLLHPIGGVIVPLCQSVITGMLGGLIALALGGVFWHWATAITLFTWLILIIRWGDLVREVIHPSPDPLPDPPTIKIAVVAEDHRSGMLAELKGYNLVDLIELARGLESGATFSESSWTGSNRPFTRSQFHTLRNIFLSRGWAVWRSPSTPARGIILSPQGKAVTRYLSSVQIPTPLLNPVNPKK